MIIKNKKPIRLLIGAFFMLFAMGGLCGGEALAFTEGDHVTVTLEGCRNDGAISLPNGEDQFICPDSAYTTGNLGKGWSELDLVPHRLITELGNQASATTDYNVYIAADYLTNGKTGYDVISVPMVNSAMSDASCTVSAGAQSTQGSSSAPFGGGTDVVVFRELTIHQAKNTTCVFDYYERLSLGSHLYPGASLQSYLFEEAGLSGGKKTVPIPVNEILPQELSKDMSASQDSTQAWSLTKEATPAKVSFGDVCSPDFTDSKPVTITVKWELLPAVPGYITAIANIYANNPASRTITVNVTDNIYNGTPPPDPSAIPLSTKECAPYDVLANTESLVCTDQVDLPATDGNVGDYLNDVATATYTDKFTGVPVPGQTTAVAYTQIAPGSNIIARADITDVESITGEGLAFSVADPGIGSFLEGYNPGDETIGPVSWQVQDQMAGGQAVFNKTLYLDGQKVTKGKLSDTATLATNSQTLTSGPKKIWIWSKARVELTICKTIPDILDTGDKLVVPFHISRGSDPLYSADVSLTFEGGGPIELCSASLTGLVPDSYTVEEKTAEVCFYAATDPNTCLTPIGLQPSGGSQQTVNLSLDENNKVTACAGTATFNNTLTSEGYATAKVCKVTNPILDASDPDYNWTFTMTGPGLNTTASAAANDANCALFTDGLGDPLLLGEGTYYVTETTKTGWDLNSAVPNDGSAPTVCTFTVDLPQDAGAPKTCTFTNTKRGTGKVVKTVQGQPPSGDQSFTFQIRQGASTTEVGTILESGIANAANGGIINFAELLVPTTQTYQLCEIVMPGWTTTLGPPSYTVYNPDGQNDTVCTDFTVNPGEMKTFTVDNDPPPGGRALTIGFWKNHSSCSKSKGHQEYVLDETLEAAGGILVGGKTVEDCTEAVHLLNKENCDSKKMASDPLFNMAAQLVAAELNLASGAYTCSAVATAITDANALLGKYGFDLCNGYEGGKKGLPAADATLANNLAKFLDDYNNDRVGICP